MKKKVEKLLVRLKELESLLGDPGVFSDQKRYRELTQEHSYLLDVQRVHDEIIQVEKQLVDNVELLKSERDPDFVSVLQEDVELLRQRSADLNSSLENLLIPPDPRDHRNTIIELRAGTGGQEAALFVADCVRMYQMYANDRGWRFEELSATESDLGGYKEFIMVLSGPNVYRHLQYEGGTHRVQRVPATEAQGRVHTSAITVAILHEPEPDEEVVILDKDLKIDTYRSSGAGGQHVNVTDSAVRLTHLPTGIVVTCQDERSQHKNKAKAMRVLQARIAEAESLKKNQEISDNRNSQVGSGDRSERIRTYNFSQNRITDHRINFTRYNLDRVMQGQLDELTTALVAYFHQEKLAGDE